MERLKWLEGKQVYLTATALLQVALANAVGLIGSTVTQSLYGVLGAIGLAALRYDLQREGQASRLVTTMMMGDLARLFGEARLPPGSDEPVLIPDDGLKTGRSIDKPFFTGLLVSPIILVFGQQLV